MGTTKTMIYQQDRGIVLNESSVVAINNRTDQILAVGDQARRMLGKTPPHIAASAPLEGGIISDFEVAEKMLRYFFGQVQAGRFAFSIKPRAVVGIPLDVTEVEKKAVEDVVASAGASEVFLVEKIVAAAIGARIPIQDPSGNMIVNIGGGLTETAVISLDGVVNWRVSKIAGLSLDRDIIKFARNEFNLVLGEMVAEEIKTKVGSAVELKEPLEIEMRGREAVSGLPREVIVTSGQVQEAIADSVRNILEVIKTTLETTPPELVADIYQKGIILTGGGALLKGLDKYIAENVEVAVQVADDPQTCAARGMGVILDDQRLLDDIAVPSSSE